MNKQAFLEENLNLLREYRNGHENAKAKLIEKNMPLVRSIASRFIGRGCENEDLISIGTIGLLKAIEGFNEDFGYSFSTYAFPLITGEIKRFLRDDGIVKISRALKKNAYTVLSAKEKFIMQNGRDPKISELCEICGLSCQEIIDALEASTPVLSLEEKICEGEHNYTLSDKISGFDSIEHLTEKFALSEEIEVLSDFEKHLIKLRFYKNLTQTQTAHILGTTQVSVSRAEKKIINKLRTVFL